MMHFNKESFEQAVNSGKLVMVDFWASWCGPCRMLSPVIDGLDKRYEGKVVIAKVNVDEEQELAITNGVMSIPTVVFFKDGKEIDRKVAYKSNYPKRTPVFAVNSLALPEDAPVIPEEGVGGGFVEEEDNIVDFVPDEGGSDDFVIPEE